MCVSLSQIQRSRETSPLQLSNWTGVKLLKKRGGRERAARRASDRRKDGLGTAGGRERLG
jgi:hypothetical protein